MYSKSRTPGIQGSGLRVQVSRGNFILCCPYLYPWSTRYFFTSHIVVIIFVVCSGFSVPRLGFISTPKRRTRNPTAGRNPEPRRPEPEPQPAGTPNPTRQTTKTVKTMPARNRSLKHRPATGFPHDPRGVQGRWVDTNTNTNPSPSASEPDRHTVCRGRNGERRLI